jgi:hypothetical protein
MFLRRKGQSTAEYAIIFALVIAVAAGVLQVALKGGIRKKNAQALDYMLNADNGKIDEANPNLGGTGVSLFSEDWRKTTIAKDSYVDKKVMKKGGLEQKRQVQETATESVSLEKVTGDND